jgi:DnaJ-domain-containing protein 1
MKNITQLFKRLLFKYLNRLGERILERGFACGFERFEQRFKQTNTNQSWKRERNNYGGETPIERYYKILEIPYGSDLSTVKKAYKSLMLKYHPDRYQDPKSYQIATELSQSISQAYKELERYLTRRI